MKTSSERAAAFGRAVALKGSLAARAAGILGFVGLIALGAHMKIGGPVPLTLQTFFVLLAGALLGPVDAVAAVCLYLAAGALAVPVFANAGGAAGLAYFTGLTGGYLVGFVAAALLVGLAARRSRRFSTLVSAFVGGALLILTLGVLHLCVVCGMPPAKAFSVGFIGFVPGDILKALAALVVYRKLRGALQRE